MATILIIEYRPLERKELASILHTRGHEVVEASDSQEALDTLTRMSPDAVISDMLMPTADGFEFVQRMREIPALAATPVLFYTATYHEREVRAVAKRCGVIDILTKPSTPAAILACVDAALGSTTAVPSARSERATLDRAHLHLVSSTLAARIDRVEAEKERMKAVLEVAEQVAAERDPVAMLYKLCAEARHVTLAQHAVAGLLTEEGSPRETLYTSGLDDAATIGLKPPSLDSAVLTCVVRERRPVRTRNPEGRPEVLGLPAGHPAVSSLLSVPIASSSRVYGWLSLQNKLGSDEFTDIDERVAVTLGVHAGLAYENARLFDQLRQRATAVEQELVHISGLVREEERARLSQALHHQLGQVLIGLKVDSQWLALQLSPIIACSRRDITERVDSIVHCLDSTIGSVRTMARERRPAAPDKLGLVGAIAWQAQECERRSGIRCRMDSRIDQISLESTRETAVVRTVQEALMNVLQHAQATRATVTVGKSVKSLTVSVADNGRGISSRELANSSSLGLTGMREQAVRLGGRLNVYRRRPRGTVVRLTVPLVAAKGSRA